MSRKYRLEQGESVPEGVRRIALGRIDHALDELRGGTGSTPVEAVHEARKDMKKLRALLRLVRGELGDEVYRRENAAFRDAAAELSGVRDADVMLETLAKLDVDLPRLRQALEAHRIRTAGGPGDAVAMLEEARTRVESWPLRQHGFQVFEDGLRRSYRRGRRGSQAPPSVEALHEWRKAVKDLWYHLLLLQEAWKPVMKSLADETHELSERLGDDHDLAVLLDWAREHASADGLEPLVEQRRAALQAEAYAYAGRLYADKPGAFVARIEAWWEASLRVA